MGIKYLLIRWQEKLFCFDFVGLYWQIFFLQWYTIPIIKLNILSQNLIFVSHLIVFTHHGCHQYIFASTSLSFPLHIVSCSLSCNANPCDSDTVNCCREHCRVLISIFTTIFCVQMHFEAVVVTLYCSSLKHIFSVIPRISPISLLNSIDHCLLGNNSLSCSVLFSIWDDILSPTAILFFSSNGNLLLNPSLQSFPLVAYWSSSGCGLLHPPA